MVAQSISTVQIFYCYAQEDEAFREQLARHLSPLRRIRYITGWHNRDIRAGTDEEQERQTHLDAADIILLLISADFFASDFCWAVEMQQALEKHYAGVAWVVPVLLRPVEWKETPIGKLFALPTNKKPITQWENQDEAWLNVVQGIREIVGIFLSRQHLSSEEADILYPERGHLSGQTIGENGVLPILEGTQT